jgi:hypothetical protein
MDKPKLHHIWSKTKNLSLIIFIFGFLAFSALAIYSLRQNNLKMLELKQAVYTADEKNENLEQSLLDLRNFVYSHMNTNLRGNSSSSEPPIQLINQFNRYISAEQARLALSGNSNKVYAQAQATCEKPELTLTARAQCIQEFVVVNGGDSTELTVPAKELYAYDYASPNFSFDIAGISIIFAVIFFVLLVIRLVFGRLISRYLN